MANVLFHPGREGFLRGEISWPVATIKAILVRSYTLTQSHKFVSDITTAGGVLIQSVALGSKTDTDGVADAADSVWTAVPAQPGNVAATSLIIAQTSAVTGGADVATSAQRLIAFIDTATNFPVTPNGGDINWQWPSSADRIFKL